jgi:hypothetical protein
MHKLLIALGLIALCATAAPAQDYNPDGTPTLRTQCLMNPGLCDYAPSAAPSDPIADVIGAIFIVGVACLLSGICSGDSKPRSPDGN